MFPGLHPMAMMSTASMGYTARGPGLYSTGPSPYPYQGTLPTPQIGTTATDVQETTYLYIPNNTVGAIIGTKGSHVRNIIRFSGATVKISQLESDKPAEQQNERKVTIVGTPESQWKVSLTFNSLLVQVNYIFLLQIPKLSASLIITNYSLICQATFIFPLLL